MQDIKDLNREPKALILYTDHTGVTRWRKIVPMAHLWSDGSRFHPEPGWVIQAFDIEKGVLRTFMQRNIHKWKDVNDDGQLAR